MRKTFSVLVMVLALAAGARAQDAVDLRAAVMHGANVADYPVTAQISRVTVLAIGPYRTDGISVTAAGVAAWPNVNAMGLGGGGGLMQFTTWVCLPLARLECGGFIQHWQGDNGKGTGGAWLQRADDGRLNWNANWAYDSNRWGAMAAYVPKPGDTVYVFLVAGNTRTGQDPEFALVNGQPYRARTNVVAFRYPAGDNGDFPFDATVPPVVTPPVVTPPVVTPPAPVDLTEVYRRLEELRLYASQAAEQQAAALQALSDTVQAHAGLLDGLRANVEALKARPIVDGCEASLFGAVPVSCRVRVRAQ